MHIVQSSTISKLWPNEELQRHTEQTLLRNIVSTSNLNPTASAAHCYQRRLSDLKEAIVLLSRQAEFARLLVPVSHGPLNVWDDTGAKLQVFHTS